MKRDRPLHSRVVERFELVQESGLIKPSKLAELLKEANELVTIVVAARKTAKLAA
jgi:hypothetical protein